MPYIIREAFHTFTACRVHHFAVLEKRILFFSIFQLTFSQFFYLCFFSEVSQDRLSLKEGVLTEAGSFNLVLADREEVRPRR